MFKFTLLCGILFSSLSFADVSGVWSGNLAINGKACKPTSIEIKQTVNALSFYAAPDIQGNRAFDCGPKSSSYYMFLEEDFVVKGNEIWRDGEKVGELSAEGLFAQAKYCEMTGTCEHFDFIKMEKLAENKFSIWIDFNGAILTGEISRK